MQFLHFNYKSIITPLNNSELNLKTSPDFNDLTDCFLGSQVYTEHCGSNLIFICQL